MKRWTLISPYKRLFAGLLLLLPLLFAFPVSAHSGRTDAAGGHVDSSTGLYHYHHGYPAHQHTNGVCPYNFSNKTGQSSGTGSKSSGSTSSASDSELARYRKLAADYQEENKALKAALSDAAEDYDAQNKQLHSRTTAIVLLSAVSVLLFLAYCYRGKEFRKLQSLLYDARRRAAEAEKSITALQHQLDGSESAIESLQQQLAKSESSIESLQ